MLPSTPKGRMDNLAVFEYLMKLLEGFKMLKSDEKEKEEVKDI
jgi:hypothetical protein